MRTHFYLVLVLTSACAPALAQNPPPGVVMHRSQAGEPGPDGWFVAQSTQGDFSVKVPARFNDYSIAQARLATGGIGEAHGVSATDLVIGAKFSMICVQGEPTLAAALTKGTPITYQGCKGFANTIAGTDDDGGKTETQARGFVVAGGTCIVGVEYPAGARASVASRIPKFFASLDLPKHGCQK